MSIPDEALKFLIKGLIQTLKANYNLLANQPGNILALVQELEDLHSLLDDISKYNSDSDYLKRLVKQSKSHVEDAVDAVGYYIILADGRKSKSAIVKSCHVIDDYKKLRDVGQQIQKIRNEIKQVVGDKASLAVEILKYQAICENTRPAKSREDPRVEEGRVIGFDVAIQDVMHLVTGGSEQLEVILIVGMVGLGKTTLAKMVLNCLDVDHQHHGYDIWEFVYVSKGYERREVFLKILNSFTKMDDEMSDDEVGRMSDDKLEKHLRKNLEGKQKMVGRMSDDEVSRMSDDELEKHLRKNLEGTQYCIVLDDVLEKVDWDRLKYAFPNNKKRCRILITTRHEKVAMHAKIPHTHLYKLEFLLLDKSRELLHWLVFRDNISHRTFERWEEEIARKCQGLPWAVTSIAGIIRDRCDEVDWWKHVAENVQHYVTRDEQSTKVIELMYTYLPNHLKSCFIYLSVFPEGFEIEASELMLLWMAEPHFIRQEGSVLTLEDIAEQYLEELVYRNLVMVGKRRSNGKIKTCIVHDTLHEFCKKQGKEENLVQEIKKNNLHSSTENFVPVQHRRVCINNANVLEFISSLPSGKRMLSLLTFGREEILVKRKDLSTIPKTSKKITVLEIQALKFCHFPNGLNRLVCLRYLALSFKSSSLPKSMSACRNLQTLIVNTESPTLKIKADIWKWKQLRHFHSNTSTILPSLNSKHQKRENEVVIVHNIQSLSTISPESCNKEILDRIGNVKELGVSGDLAKLWESRGGYIPFNNFKNLTCLQRLKLVNYGSTSPGLDRVPSEDSFPQQLKHLTLSGTRLDWKEMAKLEKLENLEILKLKENAFKGKNWTTGMGGFRQLKHLHIGTTDLEDWEASADHFPEVRCLKLKDCAKLKAVPAGFVDIPKLSVYPPDHLMP